MPKETAYIHTHTAALVSTHPSIEQLIEKSYAGAPNPKGDPPSSRELQALHDKIKEGVAQFMGKRGSVCDRSMRQLAQKRNAQFRAQQEREMEQARVRREEEEVERKKARKISKKRSRDEMEVDAEGSESREEKKEVLPSVGAHGVARQDGVGVHEGESYSRSLAVTWRAGVKVVIPPTSVSYCSQHIRSRGEQHHRHFLNHAS